MISVDNIILTKTVFITNYRLFPWIDDESNKWHSAYHRFCNKRLNVSDIDDCSSNPCQNSGMCVDKVAEYQCTCLNGFTGNHCEISEWYFSWWLMILLIFDIIDHSEMILIDDI